MSISHPWYKRYPLDFIHGTMGLSLEEKGAYSLILDLIYDKGGAIVDDTRYLAGICNISLRKWSSLRKRLIETNKIIIEDGFIFNIRAEKEIDALIKLDQKLRESGAKGGRKRVKNALHANNINVIDEDSLNQPFKHISFIEKEEEKEKDSILSIHPSYTSTSLSKEHDQANSITNCDESHLKAKKVKQNGTPNKNEQPPQAKDSTLQTSLQDSGLVPPSSKNALQASPHNNELYASSRDGEQVSTHAKGKKQSSTRNRLRQTSSRGCRLPIDFEPDFTIATQEGFAPVQAQRLFKNFKDYWNTKTGKDATKRDWQATWRNWVRSPYSKSFKGNSHAPTSNAATSNCGPASDKQSYHASVSAQMHHIAFEYGFNASANTHDGRLSDIFSSGEETDRRPNFENT